MQRHESVRDGQGENDSKGGVQLLNEYLDDPPDVKLWPDARQECHRCGKRGRLYCSDCLVFVGTPSGVETPTNLQLPLQVMRI